MVDELDRKIISILQKDARLSYREIAKKLGIAVGTVYNRLKKLEEEKVILGFTPKLDYSKLGYDLTTIIGVRAQGKRIIEIEREISKDPHVACVYDVTGEYDIIVIAKFRGREDMNKFVKKLLRIDGVEKTYTHVAMEVVKEDLTLEV
ncbi:AsnC family transcriptional regulator [Thermococcus sp. EP1]|uniref:Lrp/AsnC family transcriptional regulator n=1 Tax=Thermococcus sp. EP1 TaxID=1591054 RepID=UPI0006DA4147|nr:Lrp/AsnC family transcriptional regulator [Thermococcus sp. EP1]KPU62642.1 AsnC family transcriptional regulator [Thermococcus sp. EP1]